MRLKNGEFQFGFSGLGKNRGDDGLKTENKNKLKCKIEPFEVSFPKPDLHLVLKTKPYDFPF